MLQRRGIKAVISALENDEATLVLLERANDTPELDLIRKLCDEKNVKIEEGSQTDIWRMARITLPLAEGGIGFMS